MILLDDKEIIKNINLSKERTYSLGDGTFVTTFDTSSLNKAQLRKVAEWLESKSGLMEFINMHYEDEWQTLLKEAGLKE